MLYSIINVLLYCESYITKPFMITVHDILVFRESNSSNPNDWTFKLKNCFLENQFEETAFTYQIDPNGYSPNASFLEDEFIVSAIVTLGSIVFGAIKNIYGYVSRLEVLHDKR